MATISPLVTNLFIQQCLAAGYIEHPENYKIVVELPRSFLFISKCPVTYEWIVSKFYKHEKDWAAHPSAVTDSYDEALAAFNIELQAALKDDN